jgi:hypothetical protein
MDKATSKNWGGKRKGSGRPASGADPVRAIRLSDSLVAAVDRWASKELEPPAARSEAIRQLIEAGLKAKRRAKQKSTAAPQAPAFIRSFEFLQMAEQFFGGYKLIPNRFPVIDYAKYFLFCHAIEVALKAFLIWIGDSEQQLRDEFGHDLARLLREAKGRGLGITEDEVRALSNLDKPHQSYWARYPRTDWSSGEGIPTVEQFEPQALRVLDTVSGVLSGADMIRSWVKRPST